MYNGYTFGNIKVYNPWSSVLFLDRAARHETLTLLAFWANSSGNDIVRNLIDRAGDAERKQVETLLSGGMIRQEIHLDITYEEINKNTGNLWNFLFFTGYLTLAPDKAVELAGTRIWAWLSIPNGEVKAIYQNQIQGWFEDNINGKNYEAFYKALLSGDTEGMTNEINRILSRSISFMDSAENFYHGLFLGMLSGIGEGYSILSNRESGEGRSDISIQSTVNKSFAVVFELKVAQNAASLEARCDDALKQIVDKDYEAELRNDLYKNIKHYGIAFYKKECLVKAAV
jgi:hypothetical protein